MKTIIVTTLFLACFAYASYSQDTTQTTHTNKKPKATYQIGSAKVIVWENQKKDGSTWKSYQIKKAIFAI